MGNIPGAKRTRWVIHINVINERKRLGAPMIRTRKIAAICTVLIFVICTLSPKDAFCLTIEKEKELSVEFMEAVRKHFVFIRDPLITDYVNKVGQKILSVMPPQPFTYHFYVVMEDSYNAFAGPAGVIFIHSGLFAAMESEEELAGIISHEIAHVSNRHIAGRIGRSKVFSIATVAGMVAAILTGIGGAEAMIVGLAGVQSLSLAYTREDEVEADESGLRYLRKAGYTGNGLLKMFKKMRNKQWFGPNEIPTYLTTHPALNERMAYLGSTIGDNPVSTQQTQEADHTGFQWANTKIIAMYGDEQSVLRKFETAVGKHPDDPLAHYGYGLILARTGNRKVAIHHFRMAMKEKAFDPNILTDFGRIYLLDGQYPEALKILRGAVDLAPDNSAARLLLGRAQIEMGMFPEAESSLIPITEKDDAFMEAFYHLGEAYGKQGKLGKSHYNLGIYYKMKGQLKNTVFHLKRALERTDDPDEKQEIEEMLDDIRQKERKALRENDRGTHVGRQTLYMIEN